MDLYDILLVNNNSGGGGGGGNANIVELTQEEYEELPSSKESDDILYAIKDANNTPAYIDITGILTTGQTSITLQSNLITTDSTFDIYTSIWGAEPTDVTVANGSITLTFEAQETDMNVKARVS